MTFTESPFSYGRCEVCDSAHKILLRRVGTARTKRIIPLFYCMDCESMTCIQDYLEGHAQLVADVQYNINLIDHKFANFARLPQFFSEFLYDGDVSQIFHADIGCNIGILVKVFADSGYQSTGYDVNPVAIEKARSLFPDLNIIAKKAGSDGRQFDLVTMIDVLEHIKEPGEFFRSIVPCMKDGAHLFISVPRVDRGSWHHLTEDTAIQMIPNASTPFRDNDVHVVHYSSKGLAAVGRRAGLEVVQDFIDRPWPLNGILLRKPLPPISEIAMAPEKQNSSFEFIRRWIASVRRAISARYRAVRRVRAFHAISRIFGGTRSIL